MAKMKSTKKYYFTVEGETEQWYLKWLQDRINETESSAYKVSFDCPVQKNPLNRAYAEQFEDMKEYKHEDNFKRCLGKLELSNVIEAVNRANRIMARNEENGYRLLQYKGYKYYKENPSMAIHEIIGKILKDCELI